MARPDEVREEIRAMITGYTTSLREAHEFAGESQTQTDNLLGWNVGLMGAALFAAPTLLAGMGVSMERDVVRVLVLLPWVLGVLFGVAGRLLALEFRESNNRYIADKLHALDFLLVAELDAVTMKSRFQAVLNDSGEHATRLHPDQAISAMVADLLLCDLHRTSGWRLRHLRGGAGRTQVRPPRLAAAGAVRLTGSRAPE
jgi:hypothetical protein